MSNQDKSNGPEIYVLASTVILGLASFIVWIFRIASGSKAKRLVDETTGQLSRGRNSAVAAANAHVISSPVSNSDSGQGIDIGFSTGSPAKTPSERAPEMGRISSVRSENVGNGSNMLPAELGVSAEPKKSTEWSTASRYIAGVGILLFVIWLIAFSRQTLTLLIFAALIAILVHPVIHFLETRLRFSAGLAVLIVYLLVALLLAAIPLVIIPNVIGGIRSLVDFNWGDLLKGASSAIDRWVVQVNSIPVIGATLSSTLETISNMGKGFTSGSQQITLSGESVSTVVSGVGQTIGFFVSILGPVVSGILSLVFMLLISMQMSIAGGQIRGWIVNPVPDRFKEEIGSLLDRLLLVWISFLHGQFSLMVVMGFLVWLLNLFLGTPQAILLGVLSGLLEVIPSLGPVLATIPAAIFALMFGSENFPGLNHAVFMLILILGYVLLNVLENQLLVPRILGDAVSLPPLIVLIGVMIAGAAAGIVGVFLATPMMASGREILNYVYQKIIQAPEKEKPEEEKPSLLDQVRGLIGRFRLPFRRSIQKDKAASLNSNVKL
jgi:predicted PurR-regulated permease PerM